MKILKLWSNKSHTLMVPTLKHPKHRYLFDPNAVHVKPHGPFYKKQESIVRLSVLDDEGRQVFGVPCMILAPCSGYVMGLPSGRQFIEARKPLTTFYRLLTVA